MNNDKRGIGLVAQQQISRIEGVTDHQRDWREIGKGGKGKH